MNAHKALLPRTLSATVTTQESKRSYTIMAIEYNRSSEGDGDLSTEMISANAIEDRARYLRLADSHRRRWIRQASNNPITNNTEVLGFITATVVHARQQARARERRAELQGERTAEQAGVASSAHPHGQAYRKGSSTAQPSTSTNVTSTSTVEEAGERDADPAVQGRT